MKKLIIFTCFMVCLFQNCKFSKNNTFKDPRDGKIYKTVDIGTQTWMAENLNFSQKNGSWCYDNKITNCNKYGRLYSWESANKSCPKGWHLPSNEEWITLINVVGGDSIAGGKLKEADTTDWRSPNTGATNEFNFNALPGGALAVPIGCHNFNDAIFDAIGYQGGFWSSSKAASDYWNNEKSDTNDVWFVRFDWDGKYVYRNPCYRYFNIFSVRCIKD